MDAVDEHTLHIRKLLKTPLEDLDLSVRAYNCLKAAKINNLSELVKYDTNELLKFRNFGKKSRRDRSYGHRQRACSLAWT